MTRPKDIGTQAETAVVRYLRDHGWPGAERRALRGALDAGDITGTPGVCWEVKGGTAAKTASDNLIEKWLDDAHRQAANAGEPVAVLVVQRAGIGAPNAGRWWAIMRGHQYEQLASGTGKWIYGSRGPLRLQLHQVCGLLIHAGYGSDPDPACERCGTTVHVWKPEDGPGPYLCGLCNGQGIGTAAPR